MAKSGTNVHPKSEVRRLNDPISTVFGQTSEFSDEVGTEITLLKLVFVPLCLNRQGRSALPFPFEDMQIQSRYRVYVPRDVEKDRKGLKRKRTEVKVYNYRDAVGVEYLNSISGNNRSTNGINK